MRFAWLPDGELLINWVSLGHRVFSVIISVMLAACVSVMLLK